jgi:hypothetical protein
MLDQLLGSTFVQNFTQSTQGKQATEVLAKGGLSQDQITKVIAEGLPAAATALKSQVTGKGVSAKAAPGEAELGLFDLLGGHPGQAFLIGTVTSLVKGEGFVDAMQDGMFSIVGSHVSEVIASRVGLDRQKAGWVGAALTPFVVAFVQDKLGNNPGVMAKRGAPPTHAEVQEIIAGKKKKALANPNDAHSKAVLAEQAAKTANVQKVLAEKAAKAGAPPPKKK